MYWRGGWVYEAVGFMWTTRRRAVGRGTTQTSVQQLATGHDPSYFVRIKLISHCNIFDSATRPVPIDDNAYMQK